MTTPRRKLTRSLLDWRNGATLLASALVALMIVSYVEAVRSRTAAIETARETASQAIDARQAATRRIDTLSRQLTDLNDQLRMAQADRAALYAQLAAVIVQLQQLGASPVVSPGPAPQPSSSPSRASSSPRPKPSPSSSPRPTRSPTPKPSPSPTCRPLPVIGCPPGRNHA